MKPHRYYHDYALFTWAYIRYTQVREVWRWVWASVRTWWIDRDPASETIPRVRGCHVPGATDAEIIERLLNDLFPVRH